MNKIKLLIVDDASFMRETIKRMIDQERFEIFEAVNGSDGVKKYMEINPHVVTMDITMPILDGKGALKQIKEYDKNAIIMMSTAMGQEAHVKECLLLGCSNYIIKPFTKEMFLQRLEELVKRGVIAKKCPYEKECSPCYYKDICRIDK